MENLVGIVTKFGALAQMVARDIRIVEVRGSTPLCSTQNLADQRLQGFFLSVFVNLEYANPAQ